MHFHQKGLGMEFIAIVKANWCQRERWRDFDEL